MDQVIIYESYNMTHNQIYHATFRYYAPDYLSHISNRAVRAVQVPVNQPVCHIVCHCPNGQELTEGASRGDNTELDNNNHKEPT